MSERKINLEEIFKSKIPEANLEGLNDIVNFIAFNTSEKYFEIVQDAMLEFGKQLLELAAENAECNFISRDLCNLNQLQHGCIISDNLVVIPNKKSILDTINQIK